MTRSQQGNARQMHAVVKASSIFNSPCRYHGKSYRGQAFLGESNDYYQLRPREFEMLDSRVDVICGQRSGEKLNTIGFGDKAFLILEDALMGYRNCTPALLVREVA